MIKLTIAQKVKKVKTALMIIKYSIHKDTSIASASKKYKRNRRFVYDVNRRWVKKNNGGVPIELIVEFKKLFNPK